AYYDLAQADTRILVEWLLQKRQKLPNSLWRTLTELFTTKLFLTTDARYMLADILHCDAVRKAFDLIIIDCPPRLTTSEIQAFCASSHLLIPTIFDRTSAEAVVSLCEQVETLKRNGVCPHLQYAGVVGTMWRQDRVAQTRALISVRDGLRQSNIPIEVLPQATFV